MATQQTFDFLDTSVFERPIELPPPEMAKPTKQVVSEAEPSKLEPSKADLDLSDLDTREAVLRRLRARVGCIQSPPDGDLGGVLSTGSEAIDRLLPRGGLRPDAISEWVAQADGCGAAALAMITAAIHLNSSRGPLVVVSGDGFYPPAAIAFGIPAERIIWVRPTRHADLVWAIDQALRCESVAAVWAGVGANLDDRDARRFQLAAETGRTPGLFIRPAATRGRPTFADVRLHVDNQSPLPLNHSATQKLADLSETRGRAMKVTLDRCRGARSGHSVWVQIDDQARIVTFTPQLGICEDESAAVRLASELAHPKTSARKAGRRRA